MSCRKFIISPTCWLLLAVLAACAPLASAAPAPTLTVEWQSVMPREGQPAFPDLGQYWIIDKGCGFDPQKVRIADMLFEQLRSEVIAEVAVICQTGIVNKGATNNDKIWLRDWARHVKMGNIDDDRSVVWLIRPDAQPEEGRISIELSRWLYWYTAIDYADGLAEASNYANAEDFNGALVSIARSTDEKLRKLWAEQQPAPNGDGSQ